MTASMARCARCARSSSARLQRGRFWGVTESWQSRYHLQSYFLALRPGRMTSHAWRRSGAAFVRSVQAWVIRCYEVGLTQGAAARRLAPARAVAVPDAGSPGRTGADDGGAATRARPTDPIHGDAHGHARRIREAACARMPLNPTSDLWRQLLSPAIPSSSASCCARTRPRFDVTDWREVRTGTSASTRRHRARPATHAARPGAVGGPRAALTRRPAARISRASPPYPSFLRCLAVARSRARAC